MKIPSDQNASSSGSSVRRPTKQQRIRLFATCLAFFLMASGSGLIRPAGAAGERPALPTAPTIRTRDDGAKAVATSGNVQFFRLATTSQTERARAEQLGRVIEDYGRFVVVAVETKNVEQVQQTAAQHSFDIEPIDFSIGLHGFRYDPLIEHPTAKLSQPKASKTGRSYFLVQFLAPVREQWLAELRGMGIEVVQYVPNHAYIVCADGDTALRAADHPRVRWMGAFEAAHKVSPELLWTFGLETKTRGLAKDGTYLVAVFKQDKPDAVSRLVARSGRILSREVMPDSNVFDVLRVQLSPTDIPSVAAIEGVYAVEPYVAPTPEDERNAHVTAGNYTATGISGLAAPGYNPLAQFLTNGSNVTVGVVDDGFQIPGPSGFYITTANAVAAPPRGAAPPSFQGGHGHLCASIIAGAAPFPTFLDPLNYNYGLGVAPGAHLVSVPLITSGYTGTDAVAVDDTVTTLPPNNQRATISNNSWGAGAGVDYQTREAQYDGFVRDASTGSSIDPLCIVFSAGNSGPGASTLTRPKAAKNVITVGSSVGIRPELPPFLSVPNTNIDFMSDYSSRGPTQDQRIKPEISAPGQQITGPRTTSNSVGFTAIGDGVHIYGSGTSFAAPHLSGAAAIFTGWWRGQNAGAIPSPAMIKAALVNGAVDMNAEQPGVPGSSTVTPIPNNTEGWGRVNLTNSVNTGVPTQYVDQTVPFTSLSDSYTFTGRVADGTRPLRISLVWTDAPGAIGANPALVNDLDLTVTVGGNTYRGNVFSGGVSVTGGSADRRNNLENVFLNGIPASTPLSVQVTPAALNGNGIVGMPGNNQHFALVIFNANPESLPVVSGTGATLTAESCTPPNSAPDPGEVVTFNFGLQNVGTANTGTLVAQLLPTGGVTSPSANQVYGVLTAGGGSATRPFTFTVDSSLPCGGTITATLRLNDGVSIINQDVTFTLQVGTTVTNTFGPFSNPANISIPSSGPATPYPSTITVSGVSGTVSKVTVSINGYNHTFPDDVDVLLVGPGGQQCVLMSDAGGSADVVNVNLVFDDAAASLLPDATLITSGTYRPTNYGATDNFPAPGPGSVTQATPALSVFNGVDPNGVWNLYVVDDLGGDVGNFAGGWSLTIQTQTPSCSSCSVACTPSVINSLVSVTTNTGAPFGVQGTSTCAADGYSNDFLIQATLTNLSSATLTDLSYQVVELQHAGGPAPSPVFRLTSADGATCSSGGVAGATQALTSVTLGPGQSATATFRIAMPSIRRFRFFVNVLGCASGGSDSLGGKSRLMANALPIEVNVDGVLPPQKTVANRQPGQPNAGERQRGHTRR
ncbi:S8 family serine peptidase [Chloracidobacterium validum]|uniref:S8 family serine peptidase n=1 Tax=Chloracidobacterium validum TaxID=2821543 RepID=A0ABX8B9G0_9BACT|nr:S8 family serine peptidase [Chloracidobacterium validum]QUW02309.1 S8 family serine peptidase [Chloracidobacterium validum]